MFVIADDDLDNVANKVLEVLTALANGAKRIDKDVDIGDGLDSMVVTGYWVKDVLRLDIKIKRAQNA